MIYKIEYFRHPFSRLHSCYNNKFGMYRKIIRTSFHKITASILQRRQSVIHNPRFQKRATPEEMIDHVLSHVGQNEHWAPHWRCPVCSHNFTAIVHLETLDSGPGPENVPTFGKSNASPGGGQRSNQHSPNGPKYISPVQFWRNISKEKIARLQLPSAYKYDRDIFDHSVKEYFRALILTDLAM